MAQVSHSDPVFVFLRESTHFDTSARCLTRAGPIVAICRASTLLSFGLATNGSFERAAVKMNPALRVEAYDPSVGKGRFVELAIRAAFSAPLRLVALSPRGARAEHGGAMSIFAKIDIEGTEYRILPFTASRAELFTGLVIEFHDTDVCAPVFNAQRDARRYVGPLPRPDLDAPNDPKQPDYVLELQ